MTPTRGRSADDDHDNVFATANRLEPAGKQPPIGEAPAVAHLIVGISECICHALTVLRQQVRIPFGNVRRL